MSETLESMATDVGQAACRELLAQAKEQAVELVGPNGLLNLFGGIRVEHVGVAVRH